VKVGVSLKVSGLSELRNGIQALTDNMSKQMGIVAWKTGKDGKSFIAKAVYKEFKTTQKVIKKAITVKRLNGNRDILLIVAKEKRIPLREFKPRQDATGVSAKINRRGAAYIAPGGFMGPKPGAMKASWRGRPFVREAKTRLPIQNLKGPSPWGVFVREELGLKLDTEKYLRERLKYHMQRQLRYLELKKKGVIP
jgi:hypothetical protein